LPGYLLDTNHIGAEFDGHASFMERLQAAPPESVFFVCSISLGEIEASYLIAGRDPEVVRQFKRFLQETFLNGPDENTYVLMIDERTREYYAHIISRIFAQYPLQNNKVRTEKHLVDLGTDINDVWIVATAWKHNLTLLTTDKMTVIRAVVPEVPFENWMEPEIAGPQV
jgi:predicted nucleic acid-binding protein